MKIFVDARKAFDGSGGMSTVANELVKNLPNHLRGHDCYVFSSVLQMPGRLSFAEPFVHELLWKQFILPFELMNDASVAIYTYPVVPFVSSKRSLVFIYDLQFWNEPSERSLSNRFALGWVRLAALRATKIVTISDFSKREIVRFLHVAPSKVVVAYPGYEHILTYKPTSFDSLRQRLNLQTKFILTVPGTFAKRKNVRCLLKAYSTFPKDVRDKHKLVVVGREKGAEWPLVQRDIFSLGLGRDVILTGAVSHEDLVALYRHTEVLVHPTLYEGFGLPVLEAMAIGTPVVATDRASVPEIAGDAAFLVNPNDPEELARAMAKVIENAEIRREMREKGLSRAKLFSWGKMVRTIIDTLEGVFAQSQESRLKKQN